MSETGQRPFKMTITVHGWIENGRDDLMNAAVVDDIVCGMVKQVSASSGCAASWNVDFNTNGGGTVKP